MAIKVVIGCDNRLFGEGLKRLLDEELEIEVIGIYYEESGLKEIMKCNPDIILIDFNTDFNINKFFLNLPEHFVTGNQAKILLICDKADRFKYDRQIIELISKGVIGIIPFSADKGLLKKAIISISSGELWLDRKTIKDILFHRNFSKEASLTRKEREVVSLICKGYRNKEVAQKLNIGEQTVKSHCNHIYKKLGVSDRLQLAIYSLRTPSIVNESFKE